MKTLREGLRLLGSLRATWAAVTVLIAVEAVLAGRFLWLPVSSGWRLAEHGLVLLLMLGVAVLMVWLARRALGCRSAWGRFARSGVEFWVALLVAVVVGWVAPALLMWWVPEFESLEAMAVSATVRFLLGAVLFGGTMLWLFCCSAAASRD